MDARQIFNARTLGRATAALLLAGALAGCSNMSPQDKRLTGQVVGGASGAAIGSLFGGGTGQIVATIAGGEVADRM